MYWKSPSISVNGDAPILSKEVLLAVLDGISLPLETARKRAKALRDRPIHTSYKPSLLREYPCIRFASRFVAPLPDLVAIRSTTGVFYDIVAGPLGVRAEIGKRFEAYCLTLLQLSLPEIEIVGEYNYHIRKGFSFATPDILLRRCKKLSVIFECKATRMSYEAKFSEDPMTDAERSYKEVAKGVFQIWRFVSHVRQGLMPSEICCENVKGVLLTLDTWLTAANHMQQEVLRLARVMASGSEHDILECDQIGIVFCPIVELELTLQQATACSFLKALAAATDLPHEGWFLSSVHQRVSPSLERNDYPFLSRMGEVLPWWNMEPD